MANIFVNIPVPAANGAGAAVDMSAFGLSKTISVTGSFVASVTLEISNEAVPTSWAPLVTFNRPDGITIDAACIWMRARVQGFRSGAPVCDVGGEDTGTTVANLPAPPTNGVGVAIDVSLLGPLKTVTVGSSYQGNVQLEVSEDGITNWSQIGLGFPNPGQQSQSFIAHFMRVVRGGVNPAFSPGLPLVNVAACTSPSGAVGPPGPAGATVGAFLPEQWGVNNLQAAVPTTPMFASVSMNFDDIRTIRPGSLVGLRTRLTAAVAAGNITVTVTINGIATALATVMGVGSTGSVVTLAIGVIPYAAGDAIGVTYSTDGAFLPITEDLEAYVQVVEVVP